jgi:hypothetical protein|nr:MAG TPA: hypothetical protein [Caudoviricetes sp.]
MGRFEKLCNEYRENKRLIEELGADCDRLKEEILALMGDNATYSEGSSKASYKLIKSSRFDSGSFKADHAELYSKYTKESTCYRFTVA